MRFTIERMRTLVLSAGVLLLIALAAFLAISKWKNPFNRRDIPKRLGIDIEQEANDFTYTQSHGGHTLFRIHASKEYRFRKGNVMLHGVRIDLYGEDGSRVDRIEGNEFQYDEKKGIATAVGPVEITMMRPTVAPAIAPSSIANQASGKRLRSLPLGSSAQAAAAGEIHVRTSGLVFNSKSGQVATDQRVDFSTVQGSGSSMGATYDPQQGFLVLDHAVELTTRRGADPVEIHAQHAEFERDNEECRLRAAVADYRGGRAQAAQARVLLRDDGTAERLDATGGLTLASDNGSHLAAPSGFLEFDENNQPRHAHLEGGVAMDSASDTQTADGSRHRVLRGSAPVAEIDFTPQGELRHVHLIQGVEMRGDEQSQPAAGSAAVPMQTSRTWRSPVADIEFRPSSKGQVELASLHGSGGVVIDAQSRRGSGPALPSKLAADAMTGTFGANSVLTAMTGVGHAQIDETDAAGIRKMASGDSLEAHFAPGGSSALPGGTAKPGIAAKSGMGAKPGAESADTEIQSAVLDGNVVFEEQPTAAATARKNSRPPMHARAGHAVYEGAGQWLHLTLGPRVDNGDLQLTADKIDVSQASEDAFAHGNVKATWFDTDNAKREGTRSNSGSRPSAPSASATGATPQSGSNLALGGQGPVHIIAAEAQLHQADGEAQFRGNARLWQQANSVAGPVIILNRDKQTLLAQSTQAADPVRVVILSAGGIAVGPGLDPVARSNSAQNGPAQAGSAKSSSGKAAQPSVIRLRGGDLRFSNVDRKAVMRGGDLGAVTAETGTATSQSNQVELVLAAPASHAAHEDRQAQVDRMTASGRVVVSSLGRRGTGEQLVYTGASGDYVLTGTPAAPPRMTDPRRGTVTGEALIFHSRDDSVSIEGGGRATTTETTAPR